MHENIKEQRLGMTAPKMSAEAAEKWRQSYRRYRHRKHQEKSNFLIECFIFFNFRITLPESFESGRKFYSS